MHKFPAQLLAAVALVCIGSAAQAYDAAGEVRITAVEISYMPGKVQFQVNNAIGSCQAGQWIIWNAKGSTQSEKDQNAQAVLAAILTAKSSQQNIRVYIIQNGCTAEYIHVV